MRLIEIIEIGIVGAVDQIGIGRVEKLVQVKGNVLYILRKLGYMTGKHSEENAEDHTKKRGKQRNKTKLLPLKSSASFLIVKPEDLSRIAYHHYPEDHGNIVGIYKKREGNKTYPTFFNRIKFSLFLLVMQIQILLIQEYAYGCKDKKMRG